MLSIADLHKRFGSKTVLNGLSLTLSAGEIFGLLGPNGAGKSTTLKIATGLVSPDQGEVSIDGVPLAEDRMRALAGVGAQIDQPAIHDYLTGRANLDLLSLLHDDPADVGQLLADVGLTGDADRKAGTYSTGMRQRLAIAGALLGKPRLLILDEPTSGLDPDGRQGILELVRSLSTTYRPTILFTSHIFDEVARLCDRVGILHEGILAHVGMVEDADALRERYFSHTGGATE